MTFKKGQSGNPYGRPKGIADKRLAYKELLEPYAQQLMAKAVELALAGDTTALRICIDRLLPPIKAKDTPIEIGKLEGSLTEQGRAILNALANGVITPEQAVTLMQVLTNQARIIETDEVEQRLAALEEKANAH